MAYNLSVVTAGNIVSGSLAMGVGYWFVAGDEPAPSGASTVTHDSVPVDD